MNIKFKNKTRTLSETLTMLKNQILVRLGFVLINKQGFMVMNHSGIQLRSNPRRTRRYSLDNDTWQLLCHSWFMSDEVVLKFLKKGR